MVKGTEREYKKKRGRYADKARSLCQGPDSLGLMICALIRLKVFEYLAHTGQRSQVRALANKALNNSQRFRPPVEFDQHLR